MDTLPLPPHPPRGDIDFEEIAPGIWKVADKDQARMQESLGNALRTAFGKGIEELFPDV